MTAIELDGLTKDYGEVLANDGVTFEVEDGEIFGYLGPNGAGKTTTIRMLLGFISPTAGSARVLGADVADERALIEAKRRLGYLPDDPQFDETATGREILDLHAAIKGDARSDELLALFDPPLDRPVREYSHGNVRKLGLVTTFMHDPDLVILDEPTGGLDPLVTQRFAAFVRRERERGVTVFFSSHVLGEVRRLCDRVGIIRSGRLVTVEPVESLLRRSGKVVRVVAAEAIPRRAFEGRLDGVHDLAAGGASAGGPAEPAGASAAHADTTEPAAGGAEPATRPGTDATEPATRPNADATEPAALSNADATEPATRSNADATQPATGPEPDATDAASDAADAYREYAFTYTGDVDALLGTLADHPLLDCTIDEAPLEDVFLRFYGDHGGTNAAIDDGGTNAAIDDSGTNAAVDDEGAADAAIDDAGATDATVDDVTDPAVDDADAPDAAVDDRGTDATSDGGEGGD